MQKQMVIGKNDRTTMDYRKLRSDYISKTVIEEKCNCAGVFLIKGDPVDDSNLQVLLVENKRKNYQYSFPKGKRNKGEHTLDAAKRELLEETGIEEKDYQLIPNKWYIEYCALSDDPEVEKPHIIYYLAKLKNNDAVLCPQDTREIVSANWFTPVDIYKMKKTFYLQRRQIVTRAVRDFQTKLYMQRKHISWQNPRNEQRWGTLVFSPVKTTNDISVTDVEQGEERQIGL